MNHTFFWFYSLQAPELSMNFDIGIFEYNKMWITFASSK